MFSLGGIRYMWSVLVNRRQEAAGAAVSPRVVRSRAEGVTLYHRD